MRLWHNFSDGGSNVVLSGRKLWRLWRRGGRLRIIVVDQLWVLSRNDVTLLDHRLWCLRWRERGRLHIVKLQVVVVDHHWPLCRFIVQPPTSPCNKYVALFRSVGIWSMTSSADSRETQSWNKAQDVSEKPAAALWDGSPGSRVHRSSITNGPSTWVNESTEPLPSPLRDAEEG